MGTNDLLFQTMANFIGAFAPDTYWWYKQVADERLPMNLGGIFSCSAINFDNGEIPVHVDPSDCIDGFCCIVNFGEFVYNWI